MLRPRPRRVAIHREESGDLSGGDGDGWNHRDGICQPFSR
jgi:hypothetical protein